jgi:TonB family protein
MFESVAPETFVPRSRKLLYESLPMSIAAHVAVGLAIIVAGTWEVTFPHDSPRMNMMYTVEMEPTPPPAPPAPVQQQATPKPAVAQDLPKPDEIVAPTIIPDEIPVVPLPLLDAVEHSVGEGAPGVAAVQGWTGPAVSEGTGTGETVANRGAPGGVAGGIGDQLPPNTVIIQRHQPLPMSMTPVSMVYPFYPEEARVRGWEDAVTVRYIIGRDGRVRSVEVLDRPQRQLFEKIVVKSISHWRFRPLVKEGVAQEVIHELVVYFKLSA